MAFQTRGYGRDVIRSDMLKQVMVREERQMLLGPAAKKTASEFERQRGHEALNIFMMGSYTDAHKAEGRRGRPLVPQPPDVQCKSIGHGVKEATKPSLRRKDKWVEPPPHIPAFQCLGQFDIGMGQTEVTSPSVSSSTLKRRGRVPPAIPRLPLPPGEGPTVREVPLQMDNASTVSKSVGFRVRRGSGEGEAETTLHPTSTAVATLGDDEDLDVLTSLIDAPPDARSAASKGSLAFYKKKRSRGDNPPSVIADHVSQSTSFRTLDSDSQMTEASRSQISSSRGGQNSMLPSVGYQPRYPNTARHMPAMSSPPSSYARSSRYR